MRSVVRLAAEGETTAKKEPVAPTEEEDMPPPPPKRGEISDNLRQRLRAEATSLGEEDAPITAGFGNPYLVVIVIIGVLGVATYYQLGLDKLDPSKINNEDAYTQYMQIQSQMYGPGGGGGMPGM